VTEAAFYLVALAALVGGAGLAWSRNVVHAALFLILALLAVAGLYLLLLADFLALVQVLLYGGAVTILMLFAMMLTRVRDQPETLDNTQRAWAIPLAALIFLINVFVAYATPWRGLTTPQLSHIDFLAIGASLFTDWAVPFEIASLVLLVALMGAIIIARADDPSTGSGRAGQ